MASANFGLFIFLRRAHPQVWQLLTSHQVSFALHSTSFLNPYGDGMGSNGDCEGILFPQPFQPVPVLWLFKECWLHSLSRSRDAARDDHNH